MGDIACWVTHPQLGSKPRYCKFYTLHDHAVHAIYADSEQGSHRDGQLLSNDSRMDSACRGYGQLSGGKRSVRRIGEWLVGQSDNDFRQSRPIELTPPHPLLASPSLRMFLDVRKILQQDSMCVFAGAWTTYVQGLLRI